MIVSIVCWATARTDPQQQQQQRPWADGQSPRDKRFVVFGGDGVPAEYDDADVPYDYDLDSDDDLDVDVDHDGPGYHHVWWHHFYHNGEPHLPFPLFPPAFIPRRRLYYNCDRWPFPCTTSYEVIRWLQCYHEYVAGTGAAGSSLAHVHESWNK